MCQSMHQLSAAVPDSSEGSALSLHLNTTGSTRASAHWQEIFTPIEESPDGLKRTSSSYYLIKRRQETYLKERHI